MYQINKAFSLHPNKLVLYDRFDKVQKDLHHIAPSRFEAPKTILARSFHNFTISDNAYRSLRSKINWLYYLSKKKDIKLKNGKQIFAFRCAFITLTLPSKQLTPTVDVTKRLFNNFLTQLRAKFELTNYVWRLEFQKNGNVHYHIVTDSFLDFFQVQKIWNSCLALDGYISAYAVKHQAMNLRKYNDTYNANGKIDFSIMKKRYFAGVGSNWQNPNTVDVKSVISKQKIANYISKYFAKNTNGSADCNALDNEENSQNLRLWFCSRGLSAIKSISDYIEHYAIPLEKLVRSIPNFKRIRTDYCVMYFFDLNQITGFVRKTLENILKSYAQSVDYVPN